jgi:hypothetical protein
LTDDYEPTPIRPVIVNPDGVTYHHKYMKEGITYEFVYNDTRMALKKEGKNIRWYSE